MKNKGFTLVELLASIILIGIIVGVVIPVYNKYVEKSKINSFEETLNGLSRAIELHVADSAIEYTDPVDIDSINLEAENLSTLKGGRFYIEDGRIIFIDVTNGSLCGNGYKQNFEISKGSC